MEAYLTHHSLVLSFVHEPHSLIGIAVCIGIHVAMPQNICDHKSETMQCMRLKLCIGGTYLLLNSEVAIILCFQLQSIIQDYNTEQYKKCLYNESRSRNTLQRHDSQHR